MEFNKSWNEYILYDLANWKNGLAFKDINFSNKGKPIIKIAELKNGITEQTKYTDGDYGEEVYLRKNDLIFSWSGNPKTSIDAFLYDLPEGYLNQHSFKITEKKEVVAKYFLYYVLKYLNPMFQSIASDKQTTGLGHVTIADLKKIKVRIPDLEVQYKILNIVKNIDDKIYNNNQINDNLLELINNLYKESFSNIEEYKQADEIANITIGKTPPRSNRECFTYNEDDIKWLSISDLGKCGMYAWNTSEKLTEDAVNKYNVKVIPENTIVLSFKLTIGRIAITANKMATNEAIAHFNLIDSNMIYYLYSYLKNFDYSKLGNTSSIATAVNSKIIKAMLIGVPDKTMILEFNNKVKPLFEKIKLNEAQNETLTQLRDTLLPRLMNGEIDLEKIEI